MMRAFLAPLLLFLLSAQFSTASRTSAALQVDLRGQGKAPAIYRLEYQIRGGAISRLLLLFPIRVFYDAGAVVDLTAHPRPGGGTCFEFAGLPRPSYIMRTLGFSGKTLAVLTVDEGEGAGENIAGELLSRWRLQEPEFAARAKTFKRFPHRLGASGPRSFAFERDDSGACLNIVSSLGVRYRHHPAKTGVYFNVFPMLAELLRLFNHGFAPAAGNIWSEPLPSEWSSDELDLSDDLNRVAGVMEKAVKSLVTVQQKFPFRLRFRVTASSTEAVEICGESLPDVPVWKGFVIRELFRRVRLRPADRALLEDEIWINIRNAKGQGGFGRLKLKLIQGKEDDQ